MTGRHSYVRSMVSFVYLYGLDDSEAELLDSPALIAHVKRRPCYLPGEQIVTPAALGADLPEYPDLVRRVLLWKGEKFANVEPQR